MYNRKLKVKSAKLKVFLLVFLIFIFFPKQAFATDVVINEFLPNASQEWVELYTTGTNPVDLSNYYFDDDSSLIVSGQIQTGTSDPGSDPIQLSGILPFTTTCFLNLSTYLNNDGDSPSLFSSDGSIIDTYTYTTTEVDKSFARVPDGGSWQTGQTPSKSSDQCSDLAPTPTPTPSFTPTPSPTKTPSPSPSPTKTATPTPSPTKTPTPKPSLTPKPLETPVLTEQNIVLGLQNESYPQPSEESTQSGQVSGWLGWAQKIPFVSILFILAGVGILAGAGIAFVKGGKVSEGGTLD